MRTPECAAPLQLTAHCVPSVVQAYQVQAVMTVAARQQLRAA